MKNRICIATPVDYGNFGNRLQNYAVHRICDKLGFAPTTLAKEVSYIKKIIPKHKILDLITKLHLERILAHISKLKRINKSVASWKFTKAEIKTTYIKDRKKYDKITSQFQYYGIGGDQVLSPYWRKVIWFAAFKDKPAERKICFSPSFGSDVLPKEYLNMIMPEISNIKSPAFREQSGCDFVYRYTGKQSIRICDPVVMLSKDEWENAAEKYRIKNSLPYVVVYFLGNEDTTYNSYINMVADRNNYKIIDLSTYCNSKESYCNPMEFVSFIKNAECIFTDSFHSIMLSLILNRKLMIFERKGGEEMNVRISEIIKRYKLDSCCYNELSKQDNESGTYDFAEVNKILENERDLAYEYYKQFKTQNML